MTIDAPGQFCLPEVHSPKEYGTMVKKIAVTGGTGFIGGAVIRTALQAGWEVHSYGRREVPGTEFHQWDALQMRPTAPGEFDAVIHCAAPSPDWGSALEIIGTNCRGTRNALDIDRSARFIQISTAGVYHQPLRSGRMLNEDTSLTRDLLNIHTRSKADAELLVLADNRDAGAIILRPHAVYGPGDTTLLPRVERSIKLGGLMLPNGGRSLTSLTRIENLVQVIMEMAEIEVPSHRVYNVADGDVVTLRFALSSILESRGRKVKIIGFSPDLAWNLGKATEWFYREMESSKTPPLNRYTAGQLGYEQTLDLTRIEDQLGRKMPASDFSDASSWDKPLVPA